MTVKSCIVLCALFGAATICSAQSTAPETTGTTIRSNARLVVVDVVAVDRQGNPVQGLKVSDFTVSEDKKPQSIRGFDEHRSTQVAQETPALKLPPDTYTNYIPVQKKSGPVNILLFDMLNTEPAHLEFAKQQMIQFLRKLPPHQQFALFTLGTELHMIQGFTEDSDSLIAAADELSTLPSHVTKTIRQTASDISETRIIKDPRARAAMIRYLLEEHGGHTDAQFSYTLEALTQLARAVAVIPGRKNLIWISDSLPANFLPGSALGREYHTQIEHLGALFSTTQIAVFPVDAHGLMTSSADASISGSEIFRDTGGFADSQMYSLNSAYQTMESIAEQTGGRVFRNSNDIAGAIRTSADLSSNYYTISYRPTNARWNGDFRDISIKASKPGIHLQYRSGYYAIADPLSNGKETQQALDASIQPFVPPSTSLLMKAKVVPPASENQSTSIDVLLDPHDLAFTNAGERKSLKLRFVIVAWDATGKNCGSIAGNFDPQFEKKGVELIMKTGLQVHQFLSLKSGTYTLRIGVADRTSGLLGTLDVPLTVPATTATARPTAK
jgi:VWFA-related protein